MLAGPITCHHGHSGSVRISGSDPDQLRPAGVCGVSPAERQKTPHLVNGSSSILNRRSITEEGNVHQERPVVDLNKVLKRSCAVIAISFLISPIAWGQTAVRNQILPSLEPQLSSDGNTLLYGAKPLFIVDRPKPVGELRHVPPPLAALADGPEGAASTFTITYVPNGGTDLRGEPCFTFPKTRKRPSTPPPIWGNLQSPVPITIRCLLGDFS